MEKLQTAILTEEQFQTLEGAGFFTLILNHPQVQVYSADGTICVHIPDRGMVQIAIPK